MLAIRLVLRRIYCAFFGHAFITVGFLANGEGIQERLMCKRCLRVISRPFETTRRILLDTTNYVKPLVIAQPTLISRTPEGKQ